jgi:hypothetical protein
LLGRANTKPSRPETGTPVRQRQDHGVSTVGGHRLHRDIKSFAKRLIAIVQPQLRSDLSRAQLKTSFPGAFGTLLQEKIDPIPRTRFLAPPRPFRHPVPTEATMRDIRRSLGTAPQKKASATAELRGR